MVATPHYIYGANIMKTLQKRYQEAKALLAEQVDIQLHLGQELY